MLLLLLVTVTALHCTTADYSCLCSYHIERKVYATPNVSSTPAGYLYEFDCKPILENAIPNLDQKWVSIAFEHEKSYVLTDAQVTKQICPGDPSPLDTVTTQSTSSPTTPAVTKTSGALSSKSPVTRKSTIITHLPKISSTAKMTTLSSTIMASKMTAKTSSVLSTQTSLSRTSTTHGITSTTKRTAPTSHTTAYSLFTPSTQSTTSTRPITQRITSTIKSTVLTTESTTYSTQSTTSTMQTPTPSTKTTSMMPTKSLLPIKTTTASTKQTTMVPHSKPTIHYKQTTTDWTIVPWATKKTSPHPANYHQTTHHHQTSSHGHGIVNVGNLNLCPRAIRNLQQHGTRNLRQHGQWCYELRREPNYNWMDASQDCISNANGFVVQIMSVQDQAFIMKFLKDENVHVPIWIGLNDKGPGQEEHFIWDSGASVKYTNWDPNRMDNEEFHGQEDCVILKPNGLWDDTICKGFLFSDHHHPWICQYHTRHHNG